MRHPEHETRSPITHTVNVARLPERGMPLVIEPDAETRAVLAQEHGLLGVESFKADLTVEKWKRNGVRVRGRVEALIDQECVVTLEPLRNRIDEEVDAVFLPEDSKLGREGFDLGGEIHLDMDGPDSPETFNGDAIDVGALAEQFFGLAIDPYPRKANARPETEPETGEDAPMSEWQAKLAGLARKP
ncbi:MAG: DUF177 domain-containing protein [Methylobacterium mesophilicum]|nr:DUF177 domain-containing protein [Methylobacterium mesophilicum]